MSSLNRPEKIGTLSEAGGTITLQPSTLRIGGRLLDTTSAINVSLPSLLANNRYFVYAINNAGVVELKIDQQPNSVGPLGFSDWRLVGAFYANGLLSVGFGSFVGVKDKPSSDWIRMQPNWNGRGSFTFSEDFMWWRLNGSEIQIKWKFLITGGAGAASGLQPVHNQVATATSDQHVLSDATENTGYAFWFDNSGSIAQEDDNWCPMAIETTLGRIKRPYDSNEILGNQLATSDRLSGFYRFNANGFSNIPLEDL